MAGMSSATDVLVVGAGPTGLTMACELARHGVPCRLVDKAAAPSDKSKSLAVQARTMEVFEDVGVVDQALAAGEKARGLNIYVNDRLAVHLNLATLDSPYPFVLILEQSETERILEQHLNSLGVTVERQMELSGFTQDAAGVTATLRHVDGRQETVWTPWLVGCNGAHSTVRHVLGFPFKGARYEEELWLADVRLRWPLPPGEGHVFWGKSGILAAIPMRGGYHRVIAWSEETKVGAHQALSLAEVQAVADSLGPPGMVLSDPIWLASFRIHRRMVRHLRQGRVFLAGDAAHIHRPAGGQGMNTGIQDAYNLAWKLALVHAGKAHLSLLDSYQAERHPVAAAVLRGTNFFTRLVLLRNRALRSVRNRLLPLIMSRPHVQQRVRNLLSELTVNYRRSPTVGEHGAGPGPSAGDRAPDARLLNPATRAPIRLFEVLRGTRHALLLLGGTEPTVEGDRALVSLARSVRERYGQLIAAHLIVAGEAPPSGLDRDGSLFLDPGHSLHNRYGAGMPCLYLIRPDGYVGYRSQPADAERLFAYLKTIFV